GLGRPGLGQQILIHAATVDASDTGPSHTLKAQPADQHANGPNTCPGGHDYFQRITRAVAVLTPATSAREGLPESKRFERGAKNPPTGNSFPKFARHQHRSDPSSPLVPLPSRRGLECAARALARRAGGLGDS